MRYYWLAGWWQCYVKEGFFVSHIRERSEEASGTRPS